MLPTEPIRSSDAEAEAAHLTARLSNLAFLLFDMTPLLPDNRNLGDIAVAQHAIRAFAVKGIARDASAITENTSPEQIRLALHRALDAIEHSPLPNQEWPRMIQLLGEDLLETIVGASGSSVHRYRNEERPTPDPIAEKLHAVTLITADLAGSYNEFGIRRWFTRVRSQLDGRAPIEIMKGDWNTDDVDFQKVKRLAAALTTPMSA
ncbi:hypothetical protein ACFVYC_19455 [Pseudarthrobacter sp. NPDC058329]|uniref:hypothetical protein n=1 Tax=Pseudarthrobacter sp. NPDC058329 TaxID=3346448 RepID=UPI0036DC1285